MRKPDAAVHKAVLDVLKHAPSTPIAIADIVFHTSGGKLRPEVDQVQAVLDQLAMDSKVRFRRHEKWYRRRYEILKEG